MSIFASTVFPDLITVIYDPSGRLQSVPLSTPVTTVIIASPTIGTGVWGFGEYFVETTAATIRMAASWTGNVLPASLIDAIDIGASITITGTVSNSVNSGTSATAVLSVTSTTKILVAFVSVADISSASPVVTLTDSAHLAWTLRQYTYTPNGGSIYEFYVVNSGVVTSDTLTASTGVVSSAGIFIEAFGIGGTGVPSFDTGANVPSSLNTSAYQNGFVTPVVTTAAASSIVISYFGGSGAVSNLVAPSTGVASVANTDSSLTISPTTGNVTASLNVANPNTWTSSQTISISGATGQNYLAFVNGAQQAWSFQTGGGIVYASALANGVSFNFTDSSYGEILIINASTHAVTTSNNTLDDGSGNVKASGSVSPGGYKTASHIFSGTGTPQGNVSAVAGDYYFRVDGSTATHIYICTGTTNWTGII